MKRRMFLSSVAGGAAAVAGGGWVQVARAAEDISTSHITMGSTAALTGILAGAGRDQQAGITAAFQAINKAGGIHGRELRLVMKDDGYVPARSVENVKQMLDGNAVFALMSCIGTPNNAAIIPIIEQAGVPYVGPITGASSLRQPGQRNVFHVRASYTDEVTRVSQQLVAMGLQDIAVVYLDNGFGKEVAKDAEAAIKAAQRKSVASVAVAVDGKNVTQVVDQVQAAKPTVVFLGTTGTVSTALILELRNRMPGLPIVGLSVSVISSELAKLGPALQGLAMSQVFPDATSERLESVRNFHAAMRAAGKENPGNTAFEGYVNAMVVAEGLRRAGRDVTRDKLRQALAGMKQLSIGEMNLGFAGAAPYVASKYVSLAVLGANGRRTG
ncbi:ABC transporter substrate-binding protein [Piscinibacter terrae]|uniref:ABC transporter substrate-binding protein n=1 Tax=Piscinibacter terrae TaxID=2496871 RepID=A0A3N7HNR8_9BURK|nr:ABC transporter substrate-binding protein [Albitalea terrae]RQP23827.1 ABC transporter substrate-binding protein [Albitalea terrae]